MTFDEQIQAAFETVSGRLRDDIDRELRLVAAEVAATARREREAAAHEAAAANEAAALLRDISASADLAASARLVDAIRALDRAGSLSEILDTLVTCAAREAARIGLLLTGRGSVRGWRFEGFGSGFETPSAISFPLEESPVIDQVVQTGLAVLLDDASVLSPPAFAALPPGRKSLIAPVTVSGEVVAVLSADQGTGDHPRGGTAAAWPDAIEVMARHTARCLEALTALKTVRALSERPKFERRTSEAARP